MMDTEAERMQILEMIERGQISAAQGIQLLQALDESVNVADGAAPALGTALPSNPPVEVTPDAAPDMDERQVPFLEAPDAVRFDQPAVEQPAAGTAKVFRTAQPEAGELPADFKRWRGLWKLPFWAGLGTVVLSSALMYAALQNGGLGFWFTCAAVPFTLGVVLLIAAWETRNAPWLHLRVQQPPGERPQRIVMHFPLPLRLAGWFFRTFGRRFQGLESASIEEVLQAVKQHASPDNPLYIDVEDDEKGEKVQIFIG